MDFQDINIKCVTCGREFIFTAREQEFFVSKGFKEPRHCRECRQHRKQDRERIFAEASGRTYEPGKEMFKVVCARCQRETSVPFKPITGKPVLCKDCFIAQRYGAKPVEAPAQEEITGPQTPPSGEEGMVLQEERPSATSEAIPDAGPEIDLEAVEPPVREDEPKVDLPVSEPVTPESESRPEAGEAQPSEVKKARKPPKDRPTGSSKRRKKEGPEGSESKDMNDA